MTVELFRDLIAMQVAKVGESVDRIVRSVPVPGLGGFAVTPERKAELTRQLWAGQSVTFTPSGFGTGYRLTPSKHVVRRRRGYDRPASVAMCEFFGLPAGSLLMETLDCD